MTCLGRATCGLREAACASAIAALLGTALAGCDTLKSAGSAVVGGDAPSGTLVARLRPVGGSAARGSAIFSARGSGVTMAVTVSGLTPGRYRVMVHADGNCTSPNAFSAGPPWYGPGGAAAPMVSRVPVLTTNSDGTGTLAVLLSGATLEGPGGVRGRSVVLHDGAMGVLDAQPDVPNQRIACGVIGSAESLF